MDIRFLHFYPDLMNLYGSYGNLSVLSRLLERSGCRVTVEAVVPGGEAALSGADFLFLGAGTERRQRFALGDLVRFAPDIRAAAADGCPMLFAGTAMELLGESITTAEGETLGGIGLAGFSTVQHSRRIVGDVYGTAEGISGPVVGFMNKCGLISGVESPLIASLSLGFGNEREKGPEGYHQENVFASELTGPLLVKNPRLLEAVAAAILSRRGAETPEAWPVDPWAEKGYAVTEAALRERIG